VLCLQDTEHALGGKTHDQNVPNLTLTYDWHVDVDGGSTGHAPNENVGDLRLLGFEHLKGCFRISSFGQWGTVWHGRVEQLLQVTIENHHYQPTASECVIGLVMELGEITIGQRPRYREGSQDDFDAVQIALEIAGEVVRSRADLLFILLTLVTSKTHEQIA
jgi:hypothetical protein